MRKWMAVLAFVVVGLISGLVPGAALAAAGETPTPATLVSETSVACGSKQQGKKQSTSLLCQQYTVRTSTTEYQVRQEKPSDKDILPPNTPIEFTLSKNKMKFKVNGKKYEFLVVGTSAVGAQTR
ncbi:MAG: hypothetical protein WAM58_07080 [Candidatus Acidiferrum sp.]